jgi:hypothetical protein
VIDIIQNIFFGQVAINVAPAFSSSALSSSIQNKDGICADFSVILSRKTQVSVLKRKLKAPRP